MQAKGGTLLCCREPDLVYQCAAAGEPVLRLLWLAVMATGSRRCYQGQSSRRDHQGFLVLLNQEGNFLVKVLARQY